MFIASQAVQAASVSSAYSGIFTLIILVVVLKIISSAISKKPKKRSKPTPRPGGKRSGGRKNYTIYYPTDREAREFNPEGKRIFGIPGKGLNDATHFTDASVKSGIEGEIKTAEVIDRFVANSTNCYSFHSLKWPMSSTDADVDHVIVCGNNILVLDSKNWTQKGIYAFSFDGNVSLNDKKYYYGYKPKVFVAREKYFDYMKLLFEGIVSVDVNSVIVVQNEKSSVVSQPYARFNHLATGHGLEAFLRGWELSRGIVSDNKKLLCAVHSLLK